MSTLANAYTYQGHSVVSPPGSIMSYLGTSDPDGWIICNGVTRYVSDGRFISLAGFPGYIDSNTYTPPDLQGSFLYGSNAIGNRGGATSVTLTTAQMPSHSHSIYDPGHAHDVMDQGHIHEVGINESSYVTPYPPDNPASGNYSVTASADIVEYTGSNMWLLLGMGTASRMQTGISVDKEYTGISVNNTGGNSSVNIMPPYFSVNYIMKY